MSRSGYCDDGMDWAMICWRGAVASALRGKRGQAFLVELARTLDAMPEKKLVAVTVNKPDGCCALGAVARTRGIDTADIDTKIDAGDDWGTAEVLAERLGIAPAMAKEIVYMNDEGAWGSETPEQRWVRMRSWVNENLTNQGELK